MVRRSKFNPRRWHEIGWWDIHASAHSFSFSGFVPDWIKAKIPILLEQRFRWNNLTPKERWLITHGRCLPDTVRTLKGKRYLYKITLQEGDESNYGTIYRRLRKSQ